MAAIDRLFEKSVDSGIPEIPLLPAEVRQPDLVRGIGELRDSAGENPATLRQQDSEIALIGGEDLTEPGREEVDEFITFPVRVTQLGGTQGTATATATFTYAVRDLLGTVLEATDTIPIQPSHPRPIGQVSVPPSNSFGLAFYDETDTLVLWTVGEVPLTAVCP